ncbi:hypothetical protein FQN54_000789 [Arachnomyces sp. PD_36]|nr:hypothetical protein FQN54_000789 [Arachnomyces sp. PD_36]
MGDSTHAGGGSTTNNLDVKMGESTHAGGGSTTNNLDVKMEDSTHAGDGSTLCRWYIDSWPWTTTHQLLPLLQTLQPNDQERVQMFKFIDDQNMNLASFLLKYLFIHRTCHVPWRDIVILKTEAPHGKPYYVVPKPPVDTGEDGQEPAAEKAKAQFNISHQASLTCLTGHTKSPTATASSCPKDKVAVGIDITCVDEAFRSTRGARVEHETKLETINIYAEIFSDKELAYMASQKAPRTSRTTFEERKAHDNRIFFSYWALKEAYVKMVGMGLLDPQIRQVEFENFVIPPVPKPTTTKDSVRVWGTPVDVDAYLSGRKLDDVRMQLNAWGRDFILATAGRAISDAKWEEFKAINVEEDIVRCAKGECDCLRSDAES